MININKIIRIVIHKKTQKWWNLKYQYRESWITKDFWGKTTMFMSGWW